MTDLLPPTAAQNPGQNWRDRWVWHCDETSIAAGKISALAVLETCAAVALYWWLAMRFNWSWVSYVSLFAAPLLLLRSEASIQEGVDSLKRYWKRDEDSISKTEKILLVVLNALMTGGLTYWLASHWLPTHTGWEQFWRAAMLLGAFAFAGAFTGAVIFVPFVALGIVLRSCLVPQLNGSG